MNNFSELNTKEIQFINGDNLEALKKLAYQNDKGSPIVDVSSTLVMNKIDILVSGSQPSNEFKLRMRKYLTSDNVYLVEVGDNYKFRPDLLSYIFYGTDQLFTLILGANNMKSLLEFNPAERNNLIYVFKESAMTKIINI